TRAISPLLVPAGRGGATGKAVAIGAAQRVGGAEGVLEPKAVAITLLDGRCVVRPIKSADDLRVAGPPAGARRRRRVPPLPLTRLLQGFSAGVQRIFSPIADAHHHIRRTAVARTCPVVRDRQIPIALAQR